MIALVTAGFVAAFAAAGVAFIIGSPMWMAIAMVIAFGNIGTLVAAAWLLFQKGSKKNFRKKTEQHAPRSMKQRGNINRYEAEKALSAIGLPSPLNNAQRTRFRQTKELSLADCSCDGCSSQHSRSGPSDTSSDKKSCG